MAGAGDLIVARQNIRIEAGEPGRLLANRDVLRIDAWNGAGEERAAVVRRVTGRGRAGEALWSAPFELPEDYIEQHAELAYAGNVHVAQGRTVDTAHLVVDETAGRESLYVGMSRGRQRNTAYVVTERVRAADLSPEPRPAPSLEDPGTAEDAPPRPHRLAVLADVLERQQTARTATETMRRELERAASLATLAPIWADVTRAHATRRYEKTIRSLLAAEEWQQYQQDAERGTLTRLLRAADLAGHDVEDVLRRALEGRDFAGARSVAGGAARPGQPDRRHAGTDGGRQLCGQDSGDRGPGGGQVRPRAGRGDGRARVAAGEPGGDGPAGVGAAVPRRGARGSRRAGGVDRAGRGGGRLPGRTRVRRRDRGHRPGAGTRIAGAAGQLARGLRRAGTAGRRPGGRGGNGRRAVGPAGRLRAGHHVGAAVCR